MNHTAVSRIKAHAFIELFSGGRRQILWKKTSN